MRVKELLHRPAVSKNPCGSSEPVSVSEGDSVTASQARMERDMRRLLRNRSGSMFVYILIILAFLLTFSGLVSELYRVHSIQTHLEYEMQRAVNIAVEEAMKDSWRQDKLGKLDTSKATQDLYEYLDIWLGLNGALEKYQDGTLIYSIQLDSLTATEDPPRLLTKGKMTIYSSYPLFVTNVEVPFNIASRNKRLD